MRFTDNVSRVMWHEDNPDVVAVCMRKDVLEAGETDVKLAVVALLGGCAGAVAAVGSML